MDISTLPWRGLGYELVSLGPGRSDADGRVNDIYPSANLRPLPKVRILGNFSCYGRLEESQSRTGSINVYLPVNSRMVFTQRNLRS